MPPIWLIGRDFLADDMIVANKPGSMWAAQNGKQERSKETGALERECPSIKPQLFFHRISGVAF